MNRELERLLPGPSVAVRRSVRQFGVSCLIAAFVLVWEKGAFAQGATSNVVVSGAAPASGGVNAPTATSSAELDLVHLTRPAEVTSPAGSQNAPALLPSELYFLARELADHAPRSVVRFRGTFVQPGKSRPLSFLVWASLDAPLDLSEEGCWNDWDAQRLFVYYSGEGSAPFRADDANFEVCRKNGVLRASFRSSQPVADDAHLGWVRFRTELDAVAVSNRSYDEEGGLPSDVLPPPLRPDRVSYDPGRPEPPPGYVLRERPHWELSAIGAASFVALWVTPIAMAARIGGLSPAERVLFVPVAGPVIRIATWKSEPCEPEDECEGMSPVLGKSALVLAAVGQAATLGVAIAGLATKKRSFLREDSLRKRGSRASATEPPINVTASLWSLPNGGGVRIDGTFR